MEFQNLSGEQLDLIPQVQADWLKIALDTAPLDRARVREILGQLYACANKPAPEHVIFLDSPLQISLALSQLPLDSDPGPRHFENLASNFPYQYFACRLIGCRKPEVIDRFLGQFSEEMREHVLNQVREQASDHVDSRVCAQVHQQVTEYFKEQVDERQFNFEQALKLAGGVCEYGSFAPWEQVQEHQDQQIRELQQAHKLEQIWELNRLSDIALQQVCQQLNAPIREQARSKMGKPFNGLGDWPLGCDLGQFSGWLSACDFLGRVGADIARVAPLLDMAKCCGWSVLLTDWAFVSAKPEWIQRDEIGRLHCETGPAIRYPDGFSVFAIHGVRLPERIICLPESITLSDINAENNVAVRRAMIERYGPERFLTESGAAEIHRDDFGTLFCMAIPEDEPLVMVKVVNSTPEPDGSFKDYFLRVPPTMERAREAVAWTFGKTEADYAPVSET